MHPEEEVVSNWVGALILTLTPVNADTRIPIRAVSQECSVSMVVISDMSLKIGCSSAI